MSCAHELPALVLYALPVPYPPRLQFGVRCVVPLLISSIMRGEHMQPTLPDASWRCDAPLLACPGCALARWEGLDGAPCKSACAPTQGELSTLRLHYAPCSAEDDKSFETALAQHFRDKDR
jgi:hypothetical protein